ncbi:MAG: penicillin acylase family protein [Planctomycetaceae bacterium]|nr:penicillin acylase family protein [Planctomycetaceae bacterium]
MSSHRSLTRLLLTLVLLLLESPASTHAQTAEELLSQAKSVLAVHRGELKAAGLKQPVEVLRDQWGVPHIYAQNQDDLFFAQGFVAAQDRLFQIDMWRRIGIGETAEVLGEKGIAGDRFARLVKYRGDMQAEWTSYSPDTQQIAIAFTRGINAYIDSLGDRLPIEFQQLGFRPKHWQPEDILGRMSGVIMTRNFKSEIDRARLIAAVGVEKARWLSPTDPRRDFALAPELMGIEFHAKMLEMYEAATKQLDFAKLPPGSNNWAVTGTKSASGKPLLASDPHRALTLPSLRYLVHLHAPGWNVIGGGEPGLPGVAIGHNGHVAWGMTIAGTDQADLYVEQLNPADPRQYKVGDSWQAMQVIRESVQVRGQTDPVTLELCYTKHGPVIYEDRERHIAIALRWVGSDPGTAGYLGCLALDRVKSAKEFIAESRRWLLPSENLTFATVDGQIGWIAAALTPVRQGGDGLLPVPGWTGKYEWQGFLPTTELPQIVDPARGYVATANHNIIPPGYTKEIGYEFAAPFRFQVCDRRLGGKPVHTLDDMASIQHEVTTIPGERIAAVAKSVKWSDASLKPYVDLLAAWDGKLTKTSAAGALYAVWFDELVRELYQPHAPKELLNSLRGSVGQEVLLTAIEQPTERWFGSEPSAGRDAFLAKTLTAAVKRVEERLGKDPSKWSWDGLHQVTFRHPLGTLGDAHKQAFNLAAVATGGDGTTPFNARHTDTFEHIHGASFRIIMDMADVDSCRATSTPGQSGQLGSPHYADLVPLWAEGKYFPLNYTRAKIEAASSNRLVLKPD